MSTRRHFRALFLLVAGALAAPHAALAQAPAAQAAAPQTSPILVKLYSRDIVIDAAGIETDTIHMEEQASNSAAAQQMGQFSIGYSDTMEDIDISEAYTLKADGRKLPVAPSAIFARMPQGASQEPMFDDQRQKAIVFPDVETGDTISITYVRRGKQAYIPGQYFTSITFERAFSYIEAHGSITAPKAMALNIEAHDIELQKQDSGASVTYHWHYAEPTPVLPDASVLSRFDTSPRLVISSFKDYDGFVRAFAPLVAPKIAVTDPIQTLAGQITAGAIGHRAEAEAIYNWVSQHIRYVGIELGTGGIIPHDAAQILANGYGDCKDHVVLFSALLRAKGIDSEMVLINYGNAYTLPGLPIIGELNHAITWLPEFKLYADTTAGVAPFGVLPFELYGKPVVHVSTTGPALRKTPVLPGGIASLAYTTTAKLGDDGTITGQTKSTASGSFAISLRQLGNVIQAAGAERAAAAYLRSQSIPGTAKFNVTAPGAAGSDYTMSSDYALGPYPTVIAGQRLAMPWQFESLGRPGDGLMGPLANISLKDSDPTPCYSGHSSEDIALDAPAGRKFQDTPPDTSIATTHVTFKSHWSLSGQTMSLHRDFITNFDTALCSGAVRVETAKALATIRDDYNSAVALAVVQTPAQQQFTADINAAQADIRQGDYDKAAALLTSALGSTALPAANKWAILYERGLQYLQLKQYDTALADFTASITLNPANVDVYFYRGNVYFAKLDFDNAIADYTQTIKLKPDYTTAFYNRALAYGRKNDPDHALADYSAAIALKPDYAVALGNRGFLYAQKHDFDHAFADYNQAIKLDPGNANELFDRGLAYAAKKDLDHAIADYDQAIKLQPGFAAAIAAREAAYTANHDSSHAIADYGEMIQINPNDAAAYINRGNAYSAGRNYDLAIADFTQALRLKPDDAAALNARGGAYTAKQDIASALADFNTVLKHNADDPAALEGRGLADAANKDYAGAITDLSHAIKVKPDMTLAYQVRGATYVLQQNWDLAIADYTLAITQAPQDARSYISRAQAYSGKLDWAHAIADDSKALALNPATPGALNQRCWSQAMLNQNLDGALADCTAALKQNPAESANTLDSRSFVYFRMGKMDLAKADYDAAIAAAPKGITLYKRGIVKNRLGDTDGGKADIAAALTIDPHAGDDMTKAGVTP